MPSRRSLGAEVALAFAAGIAAFAIRAIRRATLSERARADLADEQAALRRVAMLVAEGVPAPDVMQAVAKEAGTLLDVDGAWIEFYEDEDVVTAAQWSKQGKDPPTFNRANVEEAPVAAAVRRSASIVRVDDLEVIQPETAVRRRRRAMSLMGAPITVDGSQWGLLLAWSGGAPLPDEAEAHLIEFTELVATAISNAKAREDLAASRARIVAAADEERRQVVRDLHDGAQQRLVHTVVALNMAKTALEEEQRQDAAALVTDALQHAEDATHELRELAHGIMPSVLARGGLKAGIGALASRMPLPVESNVSVDRLPADIEATAYFVVAEALTNVAKHASADHAEVIARIDDGVLRVQVSDDGVGGADDHGSGLLGLGDRLAVLQGTLRVENPADGGTRVLAAIPVG